MYCGRLKSILINLRSQWACIAFLSALPLCLLPRPVFAGLPEPLRSPTGLDSPRAEQVVRVPKAQIVLMDRALLEEDFPELKGKSDIDLREFILTQAGFISLPQANQVQTNSPIQVDPLTRREALRPFYYGRGLVFEVPGGMLDVKGSGSLNPQPHDDIFNHRNGLFALGEAIREYILERKIQEVLEHSGSDIRTVSSYAVLSWGFDVQDRGSTFPAGAIIRQGHDRHPTASTYRPDLRSKNSFLTKEDAELVERILRAYGYSTEHKSEETLRWLIDVQGTKNGDLIDFETYHVSDRFSETAFWYPERKLDRATPIFTRKTTPQPLAELMPPWEIRSFTNYYSEARALAKSYTDGQLTADQLQPRVDRLIELGSPPANMQGIVCPKVLEFLGKTHRRELLKPVGSSHE